TDELRDPTLAAVAGNVRDQVDGKRDCFARAGVRQPDVSGQDAVRKPRERLLGGVRVDGAEAAEMTCVERLEQVEGFGAADLPDEDAVRAVAQRRAQQIGDSDRR